MCDTGCPHKDECLPGDFCQALQEQIAKVRELRSMSASLQAGVDERRAAREMVNEKLLTSAAACRKTLRDEEAELRRRTLEAYRTTGSKSPADGVGVRVVKVAQVSITAGGLDVLGSMNLIAELPGLDKMEQMIPRLHHDGSCQLYYPDGDEACECRSDLGEEDWIEGPDLAGFFFELRNAAPSMIAALKQIHAGDSEKLEAASAWLRTTNANRAIIEAMDRVVAMAKQMEGRA